jgi:cell wall-associated NlpC family hydrolase
VVAVLVGTTAGFICAAMLSGMVAVWGLAALVGALAFAYSTVGVWVGRRAEVRSLDLAFGDRPRIPTDLAWDRVDTDLRDEESGGLAVEEPLDAEMSRSEAARFLAAYFAGWALTPMVIVVKLVSGDRVDLERYEVIRRLIRFQGYWRSKSLRMAGIAAMSTVSIVGVAGGSAFASSYTVQGGDDLYQIAIHNGTTVSALASANNIANPNLIFPGQVINLGGPTTTASTATASVSYTVQPGDDLYQIALAHGTTVAALAAANNIADPNFILAGSTITIAPSSATATATAATSPSPAQVAVNTALAQIGVPYVFGGNTPSEGFDCSGLVEYAWGAAGVSIPHYSVSQWDTLTPISQDELQPGDIVFYNNGEDVPQPDHEGMYIGNGQVVISNHPGTVVQTQSIDLAGLPMGFRRAD